MKKRTIDAYMVITCYHCCLNFCLYCLLFALPFPSLPLLFYLFCIIFAALPLLSRAGSWKHKLLPPPVGMIKMQAFPDIVTFIVCSCMGLSSLIPNTDSIFCFNSALQLKSEKDLAFTIHHNLNSTTKKDSN